MTRFPARMYNFVVKASSHSSCLQVFLHPICLGPLSCSNNTSSLTLVPPRPLVQDRLLPLGQHRLLPLVDALEPVSEAGAHAAEDGVGPETLLKEDRAHLDTQLPCSDGDTCAIEKLVGLTRIWPVPVMVGWRERGGTYRSRSRRRFGTPYCRICDLSGKCDGCGEVM